MSYVKIFLGGKERGLKFNNYALEVFTKNTDYETTQGDLCAAIYAGLKGNAFVKREEVDFTFEQVCDWCDDADETELVKAYNEFSETNAFKKWYEKFQDLIRSTIEKSSDEKKSLITT
jgi:hypothetical protein